MPDIKEYIQQKGTIKTLSRGIKTLNKDIQEVKDIKTAAGLSADADGPANAERSPADLVTYGANRAGKTVAQKAGRGITNTIGKSMQQPFKVQRKLSNAKTATKNMKAAYKNLGKSIKTGAKDIKTAAHGMKSTAKATTKGGIKTAQATAKAAKGAARGARVAAQVAKETARTAVHVAKATYQAIAATVKAVVSGTEGIISLIAAGGWIAVVVIVVIVAVLAVIMTAVGIFFANDTGGRTLTTVQDTLNTEFRIKLEDQKKLMHGFEEVEIRPAPIITEWPDILSVYSVRVQKVGRTPAEMTEKNIELLRRTLWAMISFEASSEERDITIKDENGQDTVTKKQVGIITVKYKTAEEMISVFNFTEDETQMLQEILKLYHSSSGSLDGIPAAPDGFLAYPIAPAAFRITAPYGPRTEPYVGFHYGIDFGAAEGVYVHASESGTVVASVLGDSSNGYDGYGNVVVVDHGNGYMTLYAHNSSLLVPTGQFVSKGQRIALVGSTGNSTGPHCHYEVRHNGERVNPSPYLNQEKSIR